MYILDAEKLTNIMICPKCRSYAIRNENRHAKQRMEQHVEKCDGKFKKNYIAEKVSFPYCPHILDNPVYEYCLANNLEFKPQQLYMTYDFETMEQIVNESITKDTTINSRLIPLSVSCCIKSLKGLNTKHFDARDKLFIPKWIDFLFKQSKTIVEDKYKSYREMLHIESNEQINKIVRDIKTVTVSGFNSSRFDSNLFKEYFNHSHWRVNNNSMIGTATSFKQFILISNKTTTQLRFIDAQAFVVGGTLKQFGKDFGQTFILDLNGNVRGSIDNSNKGVFPYEAINSDNFDEILSKTEPFKYEDFYSSLTQKNLISNEEYEAYLEDMKRFKNRWEYLLSDNENDVEMMIKPIDNLIKLNAEFNVDLISNLSLSKNAACIKYALAYKDFNPNIDYDVTNHSNTFKPTRRWWEYKCHCYYIQDEKFNKQNPKLPQRNLEKCVDVDEFDEFMKIYNNPETGKCHLCGEHFTDSNKPTLDRINNDLGHELSNCKLACSSCNSLSIIINSLRFMIFIPTIAVTSSKINSLNIGSQKRDVVYLDVIEFLYDSKSNKLQIFQNGSGTSVPVSSSLTHLSTLLMSIIFNSKC